MRYVVSNTTPLRYLIEIEVVHILPLLFGRILVPDIVIKELTHDHSPKNVRDFILSSPEWLDIRSVRQKDKSLFYLGPGERDAIILAEEVNARAVLLDDKRARDAAKKRKLSCIGTLRILKEGEKRNQVDLQKANIRLKKTSFRANPDLFRHVFDI